MKKTRDIFKKIERLKTLLKTRSKDENTLSRLVSLSLSPLSHTHCLFTRAAFIDSSSDEPAAWNNCTREAKELRKKEEPYLVVVAENGGARGEREQKKSRSMVSRRSVFSKFLAYRVYA